MEPADKGLFVLYSIDTKSTYFLLSVLIFQAPRRFFTFLISLYGRLSLHNFS